MPVFTYIPKDAPGFNKKTAEFTIDLKTVPSYVLFITKKDNSPYLDLSFNLINVSTYASNESKLRIFNPIVYSIKIGKEELLIFVNIPALYSNSDILFVLSLIVVSHNKTIFISLKTSGSDDNLIG